MMSSSEKEVTLVEEVNPLKQGLKQKNWRTYREVGSVEEVNPLKQGLKPRCPRCSRVLAMS